MSDGRGNQRGGRGEEWRRLKATPISLLLTFDYVLVGKLLDGNSRLGDRVSQS